MAPAMRFISASAMGMLANHQAGALLDQKPAHLLEARTGKRIVFSAIMQQDDRKIHRVSLAVECSGALNQVQRVCAGAVFGGNGPFLLRSAQQPDPEGAGFHDEHSSGLSQISARAKSLDARRRTSPKRAFQPRRAVI